MSRVAVVTGSNQGIGLAIVRALCKEFDGVTYLTARNTEAGLKAVAELKKENCNAHFHQLDINDKKSVGELKSYLQSKYGGIDILVNNAGIAFRNDATEAFGVQVEVTMETNYWSTLHVCEELFPLLRSHARVVNVASRGGSGAIGRCSEERRKQLLNCTTVEQLNSQIREFVDLAKAGTHEQHGWPSTGYGISKAGIILLTRIQQANIDKDPSRQDIVINAICPGYVSTNISNHKGQLTPDQGAITAVYAALLPANITSPRGEFLADKQVQSLTATFPYN